MSKEFSILKHFLLLVNHRLPAINRIDRFQQHGKYLMLPNQGGSSLFALLASTLAVRSSCCVYGLIRVRIFSKIRVAALALVLSES